MSNYNSILQTNNSSLEEIITQLNKLPDTGSGGSVDTCTVNITMSSGIASESYGAWVYENGAYSIKYFIPERYPQVVYPVTITNVVCSSMLYINFNANEVSANIDGNCQWINRTTTSLGHMYFQLSANAGETITIDLYDSD